MAFEAFESSPGYGNPRMLKRLVQTNLIYGFWPVAEKYIKILEKTVYYRKWATDQRRFLRNDQAVEQDPFLGTLRKCLPDESKSVITVPENIEMNLSAIAEANPSHRAAIEYLGCYYLLKKEVNTFQLLLDQYFGTDVLPALPKSFQEAVIILSENKSENWAKYQIPEQTIRRFTDYKKQVLAHKNNPGAAGLLNRSYGDTYWFYFMFK